ncbi:MAG: phenylalanine--tRNA ligase subunit beta [Flavobacteriales bacterium]|nr:phenylalanine--tRNA ligase subunit beta [Flavobacteriales bacterium]
MKISNTWLQNYLKVDLSIDEISTILTDIGLEVEGIETVESIKGGLEGIVIGEVKSCEQHPNADKLKLTKIDVGHADLLDIVCGAPNVATGQKVIVATVGTTLYPDEKGFKIKKSKIRGEVSEGMLCAEDEIGLGASHDGIMVLKTAAEVGTSAADYFELSSDTVFEIGLTPNRIDAASHFGVARDLAAYLALSQEVKLNKPDVSGFKVDNYSQAIKIEVDDAKLVPRYCGVTIGNVNVEDSPAWLQNNLKAIGLKPINNVVDVTNYVLHELAQPLHAFDLDKIEGNTVKVRCAKKDEKFTSLDGLERELSKQDLMICNSKDPMCIAGVFGGESSGVNTETTSIFLESAYFNPVSVRKTAKRHGLNTDASFRFERGVDPNITVYALKRAALLIQEIAGGEITSEIQDIYPEPIENYLVELEYSKVNKLIGNDLPKETVKSILENLEIRILNETEDKLRLEVPAYRVDVQRDVDLIEEILRIYGYNNVVLPDFMKSNLSPNPKVVPHKIENSIADLLSSQGFSEIFNNSLTNPEYYTNKDELVRMVNPLSRETEVLRGSMLYGGLEVAVYNQNRRRKNLKLYEFGKTYRALGESKFAETKRLGIWLSGDAEEESWEAAKQSINFFNLKEKVENCLNRLGVSKWKSEEVEDERLDTAIEFTKGKNSLVVMGKVSDAELKKVEGKAAVYYAEFNWDTVLRMLSGKDVQYKTVSKFPSVRRDLALLIDESIAFSDIQSIAKKVEQCLLKEVNLFDVYEGKNIASGKKSYAVSFTFQDENKTLTDKYIDKVMEKMISSLKSELNAELR